MKPNSVHSKRLFCSPMPAGAGVCAGATCPGLFQSPNAHAFLQTPNLPQALAFAQAQPYHALRQNCICFADFIARVSTSSCCSLLHV